MSHLVSFLLFTAVGCLLIAQRNVDGGALLHDYHGLHLALWLCVAGQLWSLAKAARLAFTVEADAR